MPRPTILQQILDHKRREVDERLSAVEMNQHRAAALRAVQRATPGRLRMAIDRARDAGRLALIAEVKARSPSRGAFHTDRPWSPAELAGQYHEAGADAISVLTDQAYFGGSLDDLDAVHRRVPLPALRKDFIIHELQVLDAALHGAAAVLLIAAAFDLDAPGARALAALNDEAARLGLDTLIEVHDRRELDFVLGLPLQSWLLGINARNLHTFEVDLATIETLARDVPGAVTLVGESGVWSSSDAMRLARAGCTAALVGEALVRSAAEPEALARLVRELQVPLSAAARD